MRLVALALTILGGAALACAGAPARTSQRRPLLPLEESRKAGPTDAAACAPSALAPSGCVPPSEAFRSTAPEAGPAVPFVAPVIQEEHLPNGIRILLVERRELPIVAVHIGLNRGADQARAGIGGFAGALLLAGTRTRSALVLNDALRDTGGSFSASIDYDGTHVEGQVLKPKLASLLDLFGDVIQKPAFAPEEIERERARRLTALAQQNDSPHVLLTKAALAHLYPSGHAYRTLLLGEEKDLSSLRRADLDRFYGKVFRPAHMTIAFAGDIGMDAAKSEVSRVFGHWQGGATPLTTPAAPPLPESKTGRFVLMDRPGATQSQIAVALPGAPRKTPDFDALVVMNTILGGQFSSRLNLNLREKHAYTYGASSSFDFRHGPGPFLASSAVLRESTAEATREMLTEVSRIRSELVSSEELADAQSRLIQTLSARFESVEATAGTLAALSVYGLPLDEFAKRPSRLQAVTREDVLRVAKAYLADEALRIVVVGDATRVQEGLSKVAVDQGFELEIQRPAAPAMQGEGKPPKGQKIGQKI